MILFVLTVAIVGVSILALSVGVIFSNRCLRGSCGGSGAVGPDGQPLTCGCSGKDKTPSPDPGL